MAESLRGRALHTHRLQASVQGTEPCWELPGGVVRVVMVVMGPSYSGLLRGAVFMDLPWFPLEASFPLCRAHTYHVLWGMRAERLSSSMSRPVPHLLVACLTPLPLVWDPGWKLDPQAPSLVPPLTP